ncbi:MAG TPA: ribonuclease P protein component [Burkholderiales bacterium]
MRRKDDFENLLRHGSRRSLNGYTFYVARRESGEARLGLLVSRRHAARAVVRNGIKRCIREAFRLTQGDLGALDVLVRPPYGAQPSAKMVAQLRALLPRLKP